MPRSVAVCGMTLKASPALTVQTDTTTDSSGSTLREAIVCSAVIICAADQHGIDAVVRARRMAALALDLIVKRSAAAIIGPGRMAKWPTGMPGMLCMP